ncbi:MAG TPA: Mpo1-like protein [Terriglobales bacterium]|nr:Mpo1-like protein [Terriglobales bacterium]
MLGNRSWGEWIARYSTSHQNPVNRLCHTIGIPLILLSLAALLATVFLHRLWPLALGLFLVGWVLQFVGHAFEGKPPEFFTDWRFLLVGTRWWAAKVRGRV